MNDLLREQSYYTFPFINAKILDGGLKNALNYLKKSIYSHTDSAGALSSPSRLKLLEENKILNKMNNKKSNSRALRVHNKHLYIILIAFSKADYEDF